ncbi:MAG: HlyD family efflux transporter periplasmic adaptor subunit [Candidatus Aminicenantes bacterium]|nr:HlyD family efflux transporter periplasmic adaptor subunit [Candidatus Aminicenantes bacterium]
MRKLLNQGFRSKLFWSEFSFRVQFLLLYLYLIALQCLLLACRPELSLIKAAGVVDGETVLVTSFVGGRILEYNLREGEKVSKGQMAARIDANRIIKKIEGLAIAQRALQVNRSKIERQIELLKRNREYWQQQVNRLKKLTETKAVTRDELERAQLELDRIEAELEINRASLESLQLEHLSIQNQREELELQLEDYTIEVPSDGQVLESLVSTGETILPGKTLARILIQGSLFVETFLEEKELAQLKDDQEVAVLVDGYSRELKGRIFYISQEAEFSPKYIISEKERKALLYQVKIRVMDEEGILKLGMPVTVMIKPES